MSNESVKIVLPSGEKISLKDFADSYPTDLINSEIDREILEDIKEAAKNRKLHFPNSLENNEIYKKWSGNGFIEKGNDAYDGFVLSYLYEMMGVYLLSLPSDKLEGRDKEIFEVVSTMAFSVIRKTIAVKIILDPKTMYDEIFRITNEEWGNFKELEVMSFTSVNAEAELTQMVSEKIIEKYEQRNSR